MADWVRSEPLGEGTVFQTVLGVEDGKQMIKVPIDVLKRILREAGYEEQAPPRPS